jgi:hypothetical protein
MNWQSRRVKLPTFRRATSHASATLDASVRRTLRSGRFAVGAGGDHAAEVAVVSDREPARAQGPPERTRQMEAVERDDRAVPRLDPEQLARLAAVRHREDAGRVALEEQARVEASHRERLSVIPAQAGIPL